MTTTTKSEFKPTAVLITENAEFDDAGTMRVDPELVTLLHLDSEDNSGWLYTKDEWENDREPRIYRRYGHHEGLNDGERVELLPDLWILKVDETDYWIDNYILERVQRIFGVYVFDRRQHCHLCSITASYEMVFLGSQWEQVDGLTDEEDEELAERIRQGDGECEVWGYQDVADVEKLIADECREGFLPKGHGGGYKVEVTAVVTNDAVAEVQEAWNTSTL